MRTYAIKICGVRRPEDARLASEAGADYVGVLVNVPNTPRSLPPALATAVAGASLRPVVVLLWEPTVVDAASFARELSAPIIQLLADEPVEVVRGIKRLTVCKVWKAVHLPARGTGAVDVDSVLATISDYEAAGVDAIVLDAKAVVGGKERRGGTGQVSDWTTAAEIIRRAGVPVLLAGGINPDNVVEAIRATQPWGVDLASGVESEPGTKDPEKIRTIVKRVREMRDA